MGRHLDIRNRRFYDVGMRTTLTLEPDVARRLKAQMAEKKLSMKQVVNEALCAGLARIGRDREVSFSVEPHSC